MKKLLIIILILLSACSSSVKFKDYNTKIQVPENWDNKTSIYGDYFSDYETVVIIFEESLDTDVLKESFNYYRSGDFKLTDNWDIKKDNNKFYISINGVEKIVGEVLEYDNKIFTVSISSKDIETAKTYLSKVIK